MMLLIGHWSGCLQFLVPMLQGQSGSYDFKDFFGMERLTCQTNFHTKLIQEITFSVLKLFHGTMFCFDFSQSEEQSVIFWALSFLLAENRNHDPKEQILIRQIPGLIGIITTSSIPGHNSVQKLRSYALFSIWSSFNKQIICYQVFVKFSKMNMFGI